MRSSAMRALFGTSFHRRVLASTMAIGLGLAAAAAAEVFSLERHGARTLVLESAAATADIDVLREIVIDGAVVDVAEVVLRQARDRGHALAWDDDLPPALPAGPLTLRFVLGRAGGERAGEAVREIFEVPATVAGGAVVLADAARRVDDQPSLWHPLDTLEETADIAPAGKGFALPPPPDPTTSQSYGCYYIQSYNWNYGGDGVPTVTAKIRWPSATCTMADGPPSGRPVLVFTHGRDMSYLDHDYLMAHLAKNGFVAVSVSNGQFDGGSNEGRARQAISFLNSLHAFWGWSHRLSNRVAFAGHSRGGEAALTAARLLDEDPGLGHEDYDVRAVISIAPTDGGGGDGSFPKENLLGRMAQGFLGIYGSRDPDVAGEPIDPWPTAPEATVFAIYDRAGSEFSSEGIQLAGIHLTKALAFVDGATHKGFEDSDQCFQPPAAPISCAEQRDVARAYFNAFLRWHIFDQTNYRGFFDGQWRPSALAALGIAQQYSGGLRRVIDNFEQGGWASSTMIDPVQKSTGIAVLAEDELIDLDPATPHDTGGMRIKWGGGGGTPWVRWSIPNESPFAVGPLRDFSAYGYLSLRAGQNYDDAWNVAGQAQDFYVRLFTSQGWSSKVPASAYGELAYPDGFSLHFPDDLSKTTMETIRVPLSAFTNADLEDVRWVAIYFDVPGHAAGSALIDSLELSN